MTTERDFDRLARAWLELSPNEAPDRTIEAVLRAVRSTPQVRRRGRRLLWRFPAMTRPVLATGVLVVIAAVLGGLLLLGRGPSANVGGPTLSPSATATVPPTVTPSPSPTAAAGPVPNELLHRWMGGNRTLRGIDAGAGTSIIFSASSFELSQSNGNSTPVATATAASFGSHTVGLVSPVADTNCIQGDTGLYDWSVSGDGRTLSITAQADTCATRLAAVPGTWDLDGCKDTKTDCLGDVAAGTYESQYVAPRLKTGDTWHPVYGALTYTVPAGWANSSDWPNVLGLTPSTAYDALQAGADEGSQNILVVAQATPMAPQSDPCSVPTDKADTTASWTLASEITSLRHVRGLIATAPVSITIDGHPGQWMDVRLDASWEKACKTGHAGGVGYLMPGVGLSETAERQRVILLDLGNGDLAAIVISTETTAPFAAFAAQAMPIIQTFTFK